MLTKVIEQAKIDHFTKWFERADKIVIVSHVSPDGDAIGSSLGLYHFLDSQEKTVNVIVPNAFPDFLRWMPGSKDILLYDRYKDFADKLIAAQDIADGQTAVRQTDMLFKEAASCIVAAVGEHSTHFLKTKVPVVCVFFKVLFKIAESGNTTHKNSYLRKIRFYL